MIRYLADTSALWRILRDDAVREAWSDVLSAGAVGSCHPQRVEFRRSARSVEALYPEAPVPKGSWRWAESAKYHLLRHGAHHALSAIDLLICAIAAQHDLVVLHDDKDRITAARYLPDVRERSVHDMPQGN